MLVDPYNFSTEKRFGVIGRKKRELSHKITGSVLQGVIIIPYITRIIHLTETMHPSVPNHPINQLHESSWCIVVILHFWLHSLKCECFQGCFNACKPTIKETVCLLGFSCILQSVLYWWDEGAMLFFCNYKFLMLFFVVVMMMGVCPWMVMWQCVQLIIYIPIPSKQIKLLSTKRGLLSTARYFCGMCYFVLTLLLFSPLVNIFLSRTKLRFCHFVQTYFS